MVVDICAPARPTVPNRVERDEYGPMPFDVQQLLRLWTDPLPRDDGAAAAAFREVYADPVTVNGVSLTAADLVARARLMQDALERPEREVLSVVDAGDSVAVVFRLGGRQVGPLETSAGRVPPTGRRVDLQIIDVLTLTDGRISSIWMVADWLTALAAAGAVHVPVHVDEALAGAGPTRAVGDRTGATTVDDLAVSEPARNVLPDR